MTPLKSDRRIFARPLVGLADTDTNEVSDVGEHTPPGLMQWVHDTLTEESE